MKCLDCGHDADANHQGQEGISCDFMGCPCPGLVSNPRDRLIEEVGEWMNGIPFTDEQRRDVALLRAAGCTDKWPLLGYRPGVGPRCRLCNREAKEAKLTPEQSTILGLWLALQEVHDFGHEKGKPLPFAWLTDDDNRVLNETLEATSMVAADVRKIYGV